MWAFVIPHCNSWFNLFEKEWIHFNHELSSQNLLQVCVAGSPRYLVVFSCTCNADDTPGRPNISGWNLEEEVHRWPNLVKVFHFSHGHPVIISDLGTHCPRFVDQRSDLNDLRNLNEVRTNHQPTAWFKRTHMSTWFIVFITFIAKKKHGISHIFSLQWNDINDNDIDDGRK